MSYKAKIYSNEVRGKGKNRDSKGLMLKKIMYCGSLSVE